MHRQPVPLLPRASLVAVLQGYRFMARRGDGVNGSPEHYASIASGHQTWSPSSARPQKASQFVPATARGVARIEAMPSLLPWLRDRVGNVLVAVRH